MTAASENGFTRNLLRAPVPDGWWVKESITLLAPDGQANVIVSREPLDRSIDTWRYATVQGDLLRKEFPGYEERAFTVVPLAVGPAYLRLFSWRPPDGVSVVQHQIYFARPGIGFTATATSPATVADRFVALFDEVLRGLELDVGPPPAPAPFATPAPMPACQVRLSLPPDGMPPPIPGELPAAVDRLVVAATDALDGTPGLLTSIRPVDAWDVAALRQECDRLLPLDGALDRVLGWADAAAALGTAATVADGGAAGHLARAAVQVRTASGQWRDAQASGAATPADLVWATGLLLSAAAGAARQGAAAEDGLAAVLDRAARRLPDPDAGWAGYASAPYRHPRYHLVATLERGSGRLLRSGDERTTARWGNAVDHFDLPIPLALARRIADLVRWFDGLHDGPALPSFQSPWNAFLGGYEALVPEIRAALGPAYVVEDRIAPDRTG